jgi:hypothetical protein
MKTYLTQPERLLLFFLAAAEIKRTKTKAGKYLLRELCKGILDDALSTVPAARQPAAKKRNRK